MKKGDSILKEVLKKVEPPKKDLELIENSLKEFKNRCRGFCWRKFCKKYSNKKRQI